MSPAGATDPRGLQAPGVSGTSGLGDPVQRIETALERIASALVRQAERDADRRDRASTRQGDRVVPTSDDALRVSELRLRLDRVIAGLRAAIDEAEG